MKFWDSSAIVPLLVTEPMTATVESIFRADPVMLVWWATEVECGSALVRLEREGALGAVELTVAIRRLTELKGAWHEVQPVESVRRMAQRLLRTHPLRAADSLQLAAALAAAEGDPASMEMLSLDSRLVDAAGREGLIVVGAPGPGQP